MQVLHFSVCMLLKGAVKLYKLKFIISYIYLFPVEVSFQRVRPDYDTDLRLDVYDTAGRESFDSLSIMYCRVAHAAIVVYDITNQRTFEKAKTWVKRLQEQDSPNIFIALAGNKADCASGREVKYEVICAVQL